LNIEGTAERLDIEHRTLNVPYMYEV